MPVEERISLLRQIDALARSFDHRIKNVTISLGIEEYDVVIANNLGEFVVDNRPLIRLSVECLAVEGYRKEKGSGSGGGGGALPAAGVHLAAVRRGLLVLRS